MSSRLPATLVFSLPSVVAVLAGLTGCVEFNNECSPPISMPEAVIAYFDDTVPLAASVVYKKESAFGNTIADAYLAAVENLDPRPVVAIETAGAIHEDGICTSRDTLPRGPVVRRVLRETVPTESELVVVELTEVELFNVLEHGVRRLSSADTPGDLVQVSGLSYEVDCSRGAESLGAGPVRNGFGSRVRSLKIGGRSILRNEASPTATVRVVLTEELASGTDHFVDFAGKETTPAGLSAYMAVEDHVRARGRTAEGPIRMYVDPQHPRIKLVGCN